MRNQYNTILPENKTRNEHVIMLLAGHQWKNCYEILDSLAHKIEMTKDFTLLGS